MGQKASTPAGISARATPSSKGCELSSLGKRKVLLSKEEKAKHGSPAEHQHRHKWRRHLGKFVRLPFLAGLPQRAIGRLRRLRRSHRLRSGRDVPTAATAISDEASLLRREAYLLRLGIPRRNNQVFTKRRSCPSKHRAIERGHSLECLELIVEESARATRHASIDSDTSTTQGSWAITISSGEDSTDGSESSGSFLVEKRTSAKSDIIAGQASPGCQARMKFLQKLSYERVWVPKAQRPPSHQTVIIFDWDDTLLCTSFLHFLPAQIPLSVKLALKEMERLVAKMLELSLSLGQTFIITNALSGWVEKSAEEYLPALLPVLQRVNVVSARSRYEAEYPNEVDKWKANTFLEVQRQLDSEVITNLVSLGDSRFEMEATLAMGKEFDQASIKTVKFKETPTPDELVKQQELVCKEFGAIVGYAKDLSVRIDRRITARSRTLSHRNADRT